MFNFKYLALKITLLLYFLFWISGCGLGPSKVYNKSYSKGRFEYFGLCESSNFQDQPDVKKIIKLHKKIKMFTEKYQELYRKDLKVSINFIPSEKFSNYPVRVSVTSENLLREKYNEVVSRLSDMGIMEILNENVPVNLIDNESLNEIRGIFSDVEGIREKALRWSNNQCMLDELEKKKENDILSYLEGEKTNFYITDGIEFYKKKLPEDKFNHFFNLKSKNSLNCISASKKTELLLNFDVSDQRLKTALISSLGYTWNKFSKFKINLMFQDNNKSQNTDSSIIMKFHDKAVSLFEEDGSQKTILISKDLLKDQSKLEKVISHELGHYLGFSDCYVEYYDKSDEEIIYYELDESNLMCSLSGQINQKHIDLLINTGCRP